MKLEIRHRCSDFNSYRAARVKSLFNAESGCNFDLDAEIPIEGQEWGVGVIVGPSGSGKTSLGNLILGEGAMYEATGWLDDAPIVDGIAPGGDFNAVTGALAAVGLGDVPAWLRPYQVLSNGEKFRADLARIIAEKPERVVVDEFTSVVDRQIAKFGALAFSKSWKRGGGKCVLLSCHYDILDWVEPDWVYDTATGTFAGRWLRQGRHDGESGWYKRPKFELEIVGTDWRYWRDFEPHHYLKMPKMMSAQVYVGSCGGVRVSHCAVSTAPKGKNVEARIARLVVMPEWQGAGIGKSFICEVADMQLRGEGRLKGRRLTTHIATSHPGLCRSLRSDGRWRQITAHLHGVRKTTEGGRGKKGMRSGYGGHLRAIQGFRYFGEPIE